MTVPVDVVEFVMNAEREDIDRIFELLKTRSKTLSDIEAAKNKATLIPGTKVRLIEPITPKYLRGLTGVVVDEVPTPGKRGKKKQTIPVEIDPVWDTGRYSHSVNVPASCLEAIDD